MVDDGGEVGRPVQLDYLQRPVENTVQKMKHDFTKIFNWNRKWAPAPYKKQEYQFKGGGGYLS